LNGFRETKLRQWNGFRETKLRSSFWLVTPGKKQYTNAKCRFWLTVNK
jgi:hypothetical protein